MFEDVDWSNRGRYMRERHGIDPALANEALADPNRLVLDPDPAGPTTLTSAGIGRGKYERVGRSAAQ
ncbi:hypothetical protein [Actinopolymorpha rutila]|uniref:Uncharacterized protein n=1 Tax=Actinopolymorpha rutila TaxID=446787 RepID=A0A852ZHA1_9ACTN|nr:hypothetical protein [Actinopolymorpha rutila]NYH87656.1 hypothetical protein [Actinopolymorpha rutila]